MSSTNIETGAGGFNPAIFAMLMAGSMNAAAMPLHQGPHVHRYTYAQNVHLKGASAALWRSTWSESVGDSDNRSKTNPQIAAALDDWQRLRPIIEEAGLSANESESVYRMARRFVTARGIRILDVQARHSIDPEEGISYAAIRLLTDMEFEAAMEADWEMASDILAHTAFPEGLTVSLRSIA